MRTDLLKIYHEKILAAEFDDKPIDKILEELSAQVPFESRKTAKFFRDDFDEGFAFCANNSVYVVLFPYPFETCFYAIEVEGKYKRVHQPLVRIEL